MAVVCPNCKSSNLIDHKSGYSVSGGLSGALLFGPLGLAAGAIGKDRIELTCLNCGNQFYLDEYLRQEENKVRQAREIQIDSCVLKNRFVWYFWIFSLFVYFVLVIYGIYKGFSKGQASTFECLVYPPLFGLILLVPAYIVEVVVRWYYKLFKY